MLLNGAAQIEETTTHYFPTLNIFIPLPYFQEKRGVWYSTRESLCARPCAPPPFNNFEPIDGLARFGRVPIESRSTGVQFYSLPQ
jgi:hypothetical protein